MSANKLRTFLRNHNAMDNDVVTHTGMDVPVTGKFSITDDIDEFWEIYTKSMRATIDAGLHWNIGITETRDPNCSPVIIDVDLRQNDHSRKYKRKDIINIVKTYKHIMTNLFQPLVDNIDFTASVFEKPFPRVNYIEGKESGYKDGIHIMFMGILVNKECNVKLVDKVIEYYKKEYPPTLNHLGSELFDPLAASCNWLIYGSVKKNEMVSYTLTGYITHDNEWIDNNDIVNPKTYSIRNRVENFRLKETQSINTYVKQTTGNVQQVEETDKLKNDIIKLVDMLDVNRCDVEREWIGLGWTLHNINPSKDYLKIWDEWSQKSSKYKAGECERRWNKFRNDGLTIASLYMWANKDNPVAYKEFRRNDSQNLLISALSKTHFDVASVLYQKYKHIYVCASISKKLWYVYKNHRWTEMEEGYALLNKMSTELIFDLTNLSMFYAEKRNKEEDDDKKKILKEQTETCTKLMHLLKDNSYKHKVLKECAAMFFDQNFISKLDSKTHLIGFENGVYDTINFIFRDGVPDDFISFSTKTKYTHYTDNNHKLQEVKHFLHCVIPDDELRTYVVQLLSSYLEGSTRDQKFHIWTGCGANGKSTLIELFEACFGDYCCKLPITLLTKKRNSSNAASPEVMNAKGKRFASLQEPDEGDKINVGYMKELSGGDKIYSRALYSAPCEFKPQFKMLLTCNQLPDIPSTDHGTWRRLRVVPFLSKFVDNPINDNEFKKDETIVDKLFDWKEAFIFILLQQFEIYKNNGLNEPECVLRYTKNFKNKSDKMVQYFNENIEITEQSNDILPMKRFYAHFKEWFLATNHPKDLPIYTEFKEYLETRTNYSKNSKGAYVGIRFVMTNDNDDFI